MADAPPTPPPSDPSARGPDPLMDSGARALADALRSSFVIVRVIMVVLVLIFLGSGLQVVEPQDRGLVLRFGRPVQTSPGALLEPGPHWALPYPIDEMVRIPIGQVQSVSSSVGWYAGTAAQEASGQLPPPGPSLDPAREGYVLTADENIIHVRGTLRYRISEPGLSYQFDFADATNMVRNAFDNALVYAAVHYRVDDALTRDAVGFREQVRMRLDQLIGLYGLGIMVDQVELQVVPPRRLAAPFAAVLEAEINRSRTINDARSYASRTVSQARAEAEAIKSDGTSKRKRLVEFVAAEARRFEQLLPSYERNPELFVQQHKTEVLLRVLTNAAERILLPARRGQKPYELRLQLSRAPKIRNPVPPPPPDDHGDEH